MFYFRAPYGRPPLPQLFLLEFLLNPFCRSPFIGRWQRGQDVACFDQKRGHTAAVKLFLGRGMDATQRTGRAPLALVAENGLEVVVARRGLDINE